jgi:hypothetical protein
MDTRKIVARRASGAAIFPPRHAWSAATASNTPRALGTLRMPGRRRVFGESR